MITTMDADEEFKMKWSTVHEAGKGILLDEVPWHVCKVESLTTLEYCLVDKNGGVRKGPLDSGIGSIAAFIAGHATYFQADLDELARFDIPAAEDNFGHKYYPLHFWERWRFKRAFKKYCPGKVLDS